MDRETHSHRVDGWDAGGVTVGENRWLYRQADEGACHRGKVNRSIHVLICAEIVANRGRYLHSALTRPAENRYSCPNSYGDADGTSFGENGESYLDTT